MARWLKTATLQQKECLAELICKSDGETIWFAWNCWDTGSSFETAFAAILSTAALYWLKYVWDRLGLMRLCSPPNLKHQIKLKIPFIRVIHFCYWCLVFVEGMKGIGSWKRAIDRFTIFWWKSFVAEGGQLDRSQRNLDLGLDLTFLKIGIQHPSIVVQLTSPFELYLFLVFLRIRLYLRFRF